MSDTRTIMELTDGTEEDRMYEGALNAVLHTDKKDYPCYVGGLMVASGHEYPVASPIDSSIIFGTFQEPEEGLTDRAVVVAAEAFKTWSKTDADERIEIFDKLLDMVTRQRYRLTALLTITAGMTRDEAFSEVDRLIEVIDEACQDLSEGKSGKPQGVWAILSAHNSPMASPIGYAVAAMLAGNTVVMIPSKYVPVPIYTIYNLMVQAGLPDGVFNLITDRFDSSTVSLANNMDLVGIVATGSGDRLENLMFMQADDEINFINELKGMNPIFIYKPSGMKDAVRKVVKSAFSFAGQRIDSCSKVVVTEKEQKQFLEILLEEVKNLKIGDPAAPETNLGPIVSKEQFTLFEKKVSEYSDYLIYGGRRVMDIETEAGYYVTPAIFMGVPEEEDLNNMDFSLPILTVQIVETVDDAIDAINCSEYGLSAGIITKDDEIADKYVREINADEVFINDPSIIIGSACKAKLENFLE